MTERKVVAAGGGEEEGEDFDPEGAKSRPGVAAATFVVHPFIAP